jgi:hypothetical protein
VTPGVFDRPLVIVSAPRAGSTLLYETLAQARDLWTIGDESHAVIESFPELRPEARDYDSHRLDGADATPELARALHDRFLARLRDRDGRRWRKLPADERPARVRFLEKTPRNSLRVSFLDAVFPDARFVFLHRDPRENVSSIMEAWRAPGFWQWRGDLPGWDREEWCMLLPPGWRTLVGRPLEEIAAFQWRASVLSTLDDLAKISSERWMPVEFGSLVANPAAVVRGVCAFTEIEVDDRLAGVLERSLAPSSSVVTPPDPEKWRKNASAIERQLPSIEPVERRLRDAVAPRS